MATGSEHDLALNHPQSGVTIGDDPRSQSRPQGSQRSRPVSDEQKASAALPKKFLAACDRKLTTRIGEDLAAGKPVSVALRLGGRESDFRIKAMDAEGNLALQNPTESIDRKWGELILSERRSIAEALLRERVRFPNPSWTEHMFVELKDGRVWMLARTERVVILQLNHAEE